jgi:hypothetical protein
MELVQVVEAQASLVVQMETLVAVAPELLLFAMQRQLQSQLTTGFNLHLHLREVQEQQDLLISPSDLPYLQGLTQKLL